MFFFLCPVTDAMVGHLVFVLPVKSCKFVFYLTFTTFIATVFVFLQNQYIGTDRHNYIAGVKYMTNLAWTVRMAQSSIHIVHNQTVLY